MSPAFISKINFSTFLRCTYSFKLLIDDSVRIMRQYFTNHASMVPSNEATKKIEPFVNVFCVISKYATIELLPKLLEHPCCFAKYFTDETEWET